MADTRKTDRHRPARLRAASHGSTTAKGRACQGARLGLATLSLASFRIPMLCDADRRKTRAVSACVKSAIVIVLAASSTVNRDPLPEMLYRTQPQRALRA